MVQGGDVGSQSSGYRIFGNAYRLLHRKIFRNIQTGVNGLRAEALALVLWAPSEDAPIHRRCPSFLPQIRECLGIPEHHATTVAAIERGLVLRAARPFDDHRLVLVGAAAGSRAAEWDGFGAAGHSDRPATLGEQRNGSGGSCREPLKG